MEKLIRNWPIWSKLNLIDGIKLKEAKYMIKCKHHPVWLEAIIFILLTPFMFFLWAIIFVGSCVYETLSNPKLFFFIVALPILTAFLLLWYVSGQQYDFGILVQN